MLRVLRSLLVAVQEGSIHRAAKRLNVSQPSLSRQFQLLEQDLGVELFSRTAQGIQLTPAGQHLVKSISIPMQEFDTILSETRQIGQGWRDNLKISYPSSASLVFLNPALENFKLKHPDVKLRFLPLKPTEQTASMNSGLFDLALMFSEGKSLERNFYINKVTSLRMFVALGLNHPLAKAKALSLKDLKPHAFLSFSESWAGCRNDLISKLCRDAGFTPKMERLPCSNYQEHMATTVNEGLISLVSELHLAGLCPGIIFIPLVEQNTVYEMLLIWQRDKKASSIRYFAECVKEAAKSHFPKN
jgi:DNA-binding transcriptional LysR family regulator